MLYAKATRVTTWLTPALAAALLVHCAGEEPSRRPLTAELPLHLEDHLETAAVEGSQVPADLPAPVEWRFDQEQTEWRPAQPTSGQWKAVKPVRVDDALRLPLNAENRADERLIGQIYVDLPDSSLQDWGNVEIRARASEGMRRISLLFNHSEEDPVLDGIPFRSLGDRAPLVTDGTLQTYRLSLDAPRAGSWDGPWTHLGIGFESQPDEEEATLDILSVRLIPRQAEFALARAGVRSVRCGAQDSPYRQTLFTHTPGRVLYRVRLPEGGRLDVGLGVLGDDAPVRFAISATTQDGAVATLLEESYSDREHWAQRFVDLSPLAGRTVTLALQADSDRPGSVALWGAPILSGTRTSDRPNIIFYVIDGGGADYMSVYGYNRRTTPNLERLAAEGAIFEHAYSNSDWTRPSTASFMTSLQHSVLGGFKKGFNVIPDDAPTMAQHLHRAGYQTAVFTANPNAGRMSGLERAADFFREDWVEFAYRGGENYRQSSRILHAAFWDWREAYPAEPYWVHFQTTDLHEEIPAVAPFSGLFVGPEQVKTWRAWDERLSAAGDHGVYSGNFAKTGINRVEFNTLHQGLYDENMAHNDYHLGRLVERIKAEGEWENTLLIVGADHGQGTMHNTGIGVLESLPPRWNRPMIRSSIARVPLLFVWPGHIAPGQRFTRQAVSMIDVLPTILDLVGLPMPEVMQGQSLAPLLLGHEGWEPRPVILDMLNADGFANEYSRIEVIDGRWGASLEISPAPQAPQESQRPVPLLLYDLWNDPMCLHSLHEERPDLVEKYTEFLQRQWEAHQALGQLFTPAASVPLNSEQLEALRSLGYIQ